MVYNGTEILLPEIFLSHPRRYPTPSCSTVLPLVNRSFYSEDRGNCSRMGEVQNQRRGVEEAEGWKAQASRGASSSPIDADGIYSTPRRVDPLGTSLVTCSFNPSVALKLARGGDHREGCCASEWQRSIRDTPSNKGK